MLIHEKQCTSVPFHVAQPLQAKPLPADAVREEALEERKPEEARHGAGILGILMIQLHFPSKSCVGGFLLCVCANGLITTVSPSKIA